MDETLNTMEEVAALMRQSLPKSMSPAEFGLRMAWGRGTEEARRRRATLSKTELLEIGLNVDRAKSWAAAYEAVSRLTPHNPSATGRAELMHYAAELLSRA